jgi:hypothetical protein
MQPLCIASTFGSPIMYFLHFKLQISKVILSPENTTLRIPHAFEHTTFSAPSNLLLVKSTW